MKHLFIGLLILGIATAGFSQNLSGSWEGNINVNGMQLPIVFHFTKNPSGNITGKWDSPKQNAKGLPFSSIESDKDSVHLKIAIINGSYNGKFIGNDSIAGIWMQGHEIPLNFSRISTDSLNKNQALPYPNEKEISIAANGAELYGTLLSKNNQQKLAIIIAGSGPTDREGNSTISPPTNEYKMLAHSLDSQGIASFRFDKRGIGKSVPAHFGEIKLNFEDYVNDAVTIYKYLRDTLGFKEIFFVGHSEGSLVGMLAAEKVKPAGYISVAGAGRPIDEVLEEQLAQMSYPDSIKEQIPQIFNLLKEGKTVKNIPKELDVLFRPSIQPYLISWLKYSPEKEIGKLKCPVLIIQGTCDIQVKMMDAENLHKGNQKSVFDSIPQMSHTLKNAGKDCVDQRKTYTSADMPIDQKLVHDIAAFIKKY